METRIITERAYHTWPSYFVVYEWEDCIHQTCGYDIEALHRTGKIGRKARRFYIKLFPNRQFNFIYNPIKPIKLVWVLNAGLYKEYTYENLIPIFCDFNYNMVEVIADVTKNLPVFWVTSKDIYNALEKKGAGNVRYLPLSIADKYISSAVPIKKHDVIQFGRKNDKLHKWMLEYTKKHSNVEYIYQTEDGSLTYYSTTNGIMGKFDQREEYMKLLSECKVSLVSTPSVDGERDFGSGVDFFTPRFFESAAMYSHMLGRYSENQEAEQLHINQICPNIGSQEQFNIEMDRALNTPCEENIEKYKDFLEENRTSKRALVIQGCIESL